MRLLYQYYPICQTLSGKLSWSHYVELVSIDDDLAREFYENQAIEEDWTIRELKRQKIIKNPHVFEFMNFPENYEYTESDIEKGIINNLQKFLLELGKGFAFVDRQQRLTLNNRHIKLKCYVLIDIKLGKVEYEHIGQMKLYLGYYTKEVNEETDNEPIGLILSEGKDDVMVEYAMLNDNSKLVVSKYQLYLPDIEQLKNKVREIIEK